MQGNRSAGGVLLVLAALLLVAFAPPVAASAYSGSWVGVTSHAAPAGASASAHLHTPVLTRRMEDEVAPEMMTWADSLLGADKDGPISTASLNPDSATCPGHGGCAARSPSGSYTRSCAYKDMCRP
uniref:Uncharacterized protein n=1 Tax=Avena sativa TaxID=4498 RepID=A0ACD5YKJ0_AVESA